MSAIRYAIAAIFLGFSLSASASQTSCTFSGEKAGKYYEIEFIGQLTEKPQIVFSSTAHHAGQRQVLENKNYSLTSGTEQNSFILTFKNPGNERQPPSFSILANSNKAKLNIGSEMIIGELNCS